MLIQIFLESLKIIGKKPIIVPIIAIKATIKLEPKNTCDITKAATAKAIPTP